MQRIESGELRGRRLLPLPKGVDGLRPTAARVRGAIFDRLGGSIDGARILDLFAGSGALSFEAISRGAKAALLVERSAKVVRHLVRQIEAFEVQDRVSVRQADAVRFLGTTPDAPFDLVLVDPPFATPEIIEPLARSLCEGWMAEDAILVCERERVRGQSVPIQWPEGLMIEAERIYGQAVVEFLRLAD